MSDETASLLDSQGGNSGNDVDVDVSSADTDKKPTWTEQVKGDLQGNEILGRFSTVTEAATRLVELEGSAANSISKLGEDATDEQRDAYFNALGRPESADGYEFSIPDEIPENMRMSDEDISTLKATLHAKGFSKAHAADVMDMYSNVLVQGMKNIKADEEAAMKAGEKALSEAWGDNLKANLEMSNRVITKLGGDDFKSFLKTSGLANSPELHMFAHKVSTLVSEDTMMEPAEKGTGERKRTRSGLPQMTYKDM
jgi:hypothetical protein